MSAISVHAKILNRYLYLTVRGIPEKFQVIPSLETIRFHKMSWLSEYSLSRSLGRDKGEYANSI